MLPGPVQATPAPHVSLQQRPLVVLQIRLWHCSNEVHGCPVAPVPTQTPVEHVCPTSHVPVRHLAPQPSSAPQALPVQSGVQVLAHWPEALQVWPAPHWPQVLPQPSSPHCLPPQTGVQAGVQVCSGPAQPTPSGQASLQQIRSTGLQWPLRQSPSPSQPAPFAPSSTQTPPSQWAAPTQWVSSVQVLRHAVPLQT